MRLDLAQLRSVTTGAVQVTQDADGFHFYRFTPQQQALYKTRSDNFYQKSLSSSGVQLHFRTDATVLQLAGRLIPGGSRRFYALELLVDGIRTDSIDNFQDVVLPPDYPDIPLPCDRFSRRFALGHGEKEVRLCLPWSMQTILQQIELDSDATLLPIRSPRMLLCFGDSITQGYDALWPSHKYTTQLARFLNADEYNKGIAGEVFFPELAAAAEDFVPDYITVAYGTNDWEYSKNRTEPETNCFSFFRNLHATYPDVPVFAIAPLWRRDHADARPFGPHEEVEDLIRRAAAEHSNIIVIPGYGLVPHNESFFADRCLHPNDTGFDLYSRNLRSHF